MVYFVRSSRGRKLIKIGYTQNLKQRLTSLYSTVIRTIDTDGDRETELAFHSHFWPFHVRGEWFDLTDSDIDAAIRLWEKSPALLERRRKGLRCVRCRHEWFARVESPAECPKCKRYDWERK